jgi:hypothetical protein
MDFGTKIVEAFGKYMAEVNGQIVTFDSESEAQTAVVLAEKSESMTARAKLYCDERGLEGKNAVGKTRIITDFLAFEATVSEEVLEDTEI